MKICGKRLLWHVHDVVRGDLELEVRLWVGGAEGEEGFHDLEAPDGVVGDVGLVVVDCVHTSSQQS